MSTCSTGGWRAKRLRTPTRSGTFASRCARTAGRGCSRKGALAARALWPTRSLVAGSAAATFDLRCLLVRCIREHIRAHSRVDLCIHIDDLTQAGTERDDHDTIELVAASAESLAARVGELGLVLADPKLRLLGSSPSLVKRALARLEALGGRGAEEHPHLGTDFCVLQRRRGAGQAVRRARLRQFVVRSDRLVNLLRGVRSRTEAAKAWAVQRVGQVAAAPLRIWRRLRGKQAPSRGLVPLCPGGRWR